MPQELPGFYYDSEKNRYFPIKGPIPGAARKPPPKPDHQEDNEPSTSSRKQTRTAQLLHSRELCGKLLSAKGSKRNFQHEYQKMQASQPVIWKYQNMERMADSDLEQLCFDMQTPEGQKKTNFLLMGSMSGSLSLYEVGQVGEHFDYVVEHVPDPIWPPITKQAECIRTPRHIWSPLIAPILMPSDVSSIKVPGKHSPYTDDVASIQHAVISTLGSETSGGSVYIMKLTEPLDYNPIRRIFDVASLNCTIWTAECHPDGVQVVLGTNRGAALLNLETGVVSWLCHSKSAIFSQQFDQSGNVILCGFRNGAIVTVDVRQKQQGLPSVLSRHRIPFPSNISHEKNAQKRTKGCFELKGSIHPSSTIFMPSSISSLMSLQTDDQYFLASSMDGSIKLYDHRLIQRGAIQSYEGHVNSHTRIELGVDASERLLMSGGEDGKVRIWSIKTGELLFGTKMSNSVPTTVCWPGTETELKGRLHEENLYEKNQSWGAWIGSAQGLFYMQGS